MRPPRREPWVRGVVFLYAVAIMAIVSGMVTSMLSVAGAERELGKRRFYVQLARTAADSGIEYALGLINHELRSQTGPYYNTGYDPDSTGTGDLRWMRAETQLAEHRDRPQDVEFPVRTTSLMNQNEGTSGSVRYMIQFQVTLWPTLNYANVTNPNTVFHVRSRGELLEDRNSDGVTDEVMASSVIMQSFRVPGLNTGCLAPTAVRLLWQPWEREAMGPIPFNPH